MPEGPKFSCPACGKQYPWKPELAGKKGKCKCGSVLPIPKTAPGAPRPVMAGTAASGRPRPSPQPRAQVETKPAPALEDDDDGAYDDIVEPAPIAASAYTPAPTAAAAAAGATRASGTRFVPPAAGAKPLVEKPPLKWLPALKWAAFGVLLAVWSVWEFSSPTDPEEPGRKRGVRAIVVLVNQIFGPRGGAILLAAGALFFFVTAVLVLIGKVRDDDSEG